MPFDASPSSDIVYVGVARIIDDALKLLGPNGEHWIRGAYRYGNKFCMMGAMREVSGRRSADYCRAMKKIRQVVLSKTAASRASIEGWNDSRRDFNEIREILVRARDELQRVNTACTRCDAISSF